MTRFPGKSLIALATLGLAGSFASAAYVFDDFSSYADTTTVIAASSSSTPWAQFGNVTDRLKMTNTASKEFDGTQAGTTSLALADGAGLTYMLLLRNFGTGVTQDLSAYNALSVQMKSNNAAAGTEQLQFAIYGSDGTQHNSTTAFTLSTTASTLSVPLTATQFGMTSSAFSTLLAGVNKVGFYFTRTTGAGTTTGDSISLDNFQATPEPASATVLAGFAGMMLRRRRR